MQKYKKIPNLIGSTAKSDTNEIFWLLLYAKHRTLARIYLNFRIKNQKESMLKEILAITGKPGLFKLVSQGNNMLIVESLIDGKRMPTYARDKVVSLGDIAMFTDENDVPLSEVLENLKKKENAAVCALDIKNADTKKLFAFFAEILPNFDRDRVYPSDIRKLITWYNILIKAGITDFKEEEVKEEAAAEKAEA